VTAGAMPMSACARPAKASPSAAHAPAATTSRRPRTGPSARPKYGVATHARQIVTLE
jgi:hypothetical protein